MSEFINFFTNHWILSAGLCVTFVAVLVNEWLLVRHSVPTLGTAAVVQMMNANEAIVIDIRAKELYQAGHILGAVHLAPSSVHKDSDFLKRNASKAIIISCSSGLESKSVGAPLLKAGFSVYCLDGGMAAWKEAQLPLVKA